VNPLAWLVVGEQNQEADEVSRVADLLLTHAVAAQCKMQDRGSQESHMDPPAAGRGAAEILARVTEVQVLVTGGASTKAALRQLVKIIEKAGQVVVDCPRQAELHLS
jgi:thiamine pyrophosphate-dependent acetolactate synthase large subunit-like protein